MRTGSSILSRRRGSSLRRAAASLQNQNNPVAEVRICFYFFLAGVLGRILCFGRRSLRLKNMPTSTSKLCPLRPRPHEEERKGKVQAVTAVVPPLPLPGCAG